jgi:hypothetical protein
MGVSPHIHTLPVSVPNGKIRRYSSADLSRRSPQGEAGRRDRYIAWGVSPRWWVFHFFRALKGRQIAATAKAVASLS